MSSGISEKARLISICELCNQNIKVYRCQLADTIWHRREHQFRTLLEQYQQHPRQTSGIIAVFIVPGLFLARLYGGLVVGNICIVKTRDLPLHSCLETNSWLNLYLHP